MATKLSAHLIADTAVTPGAYGSGSVVPVLTIDQQGRITNATTAAITAGSIGGSGTTGKLPKFATSVTLSDSVLQELSGNIGLGVAPESTAKLHVLGAIKGLQFTDTIATAAPSGATLTVDWTTRAVSTVTLTASITTFTNSGAVTGQTMTMLITQGGIGSYTISGANWTAIKWPGGTPPTLTTAVGKTDIITLFYDGVNYWGFVGGLNY